MKVWFFAPERITALREMKQLSQSRFGALMGSHRQLISGWEKGKAMPNTQSIVRMANLFSVTPGFFFVEDDPNKRPEGPGGVKMGVLDKDS